MASGELVATGVVAVTLTVVGPLWWAVSSPRPRAGGRLRFLGVLLARMASVPPLVLLPLAAYLLSLSGSLTEPSWPAADAVGWTTCLTATSAPWLPAILWASAAMYAAAALGLLDAAWVRVGLLLGCLSAGFLTYAGWELGRSGGEGWEGWHAEQVGLPGATLLAHAVALALSVRSRRLEAKVTAAAVVGSAALAAANIGAALGRFERIPYQTPPLTCWIVTAATCGHDVIVRPLRVEASRGGLVRVNRQLIVLRAFEAAWRAVAPRSLAAVRRVYDVVGPLIARRLTSPWAADAAYLALKPLEWLARLVMALARPRR